MQHHGAQNKIEGLRSEGRRESIPLQRLNFRDCDRLGLRRASSILANVVFPHWRGPDINAILCTGKHSSFIGVVRYRSFMLAIIQYIDRIAKTSAPAAIAATKRLAYSHLGVGFEAALREAEIVQNEFVAGPDAAEGATALIEKRRPNFARLGKKPG